MNSYTLDTANETSTALAMTLNAPKTVYVFGTWKANAEVLVRVSSDDTNYRTLKRISGNAEFNVEMAGYIKFELVNFSTGVSVQVDVV